MPSKVEPCPCQAPSKAEVLLRKYDVSRNGFLPQELPLKRLPNPLYDPWEAIMNQLPRHIQAKTLRSRINELGVLPTTGLQTKEEWRRAYVVLSFLAHGYIWGGERACDVLPPSISVPYLDVSEHLQLPPVATYAALNLWNFTAPEGHSFADLDRLGALHTFSGTEDESWFYVLSSAMECQGARVIPLMLGAVEAVPRRDCATIADCLDAMRACIRELGGLIERMDERCEPEVFYHQIRPFLAGSKNAESAGLTSRGVFYDEGEGRGQWRQLRGGSNGQSSLIQFLDVVLGVEHKAPGGRRGDESSGKPAVSFHQEVRGYMPEPHRRLLEHVSRMDSLRDFAMQPATTEGQRRVQQSFRATTAALAEFRGKHMQMVTRYIVVPSRRQRERDAARASQPGPGPGLTGTGGTDLIPFLKQTRDETLRAGQAPA